MAKTNNYVIPNKLTDENLRRVLTHTLEQIDLLQGNVLESSSDIITDDQTTSIVSQIAEQQITSTIKLAKRVEQGIVDTIDDKVIIDIERQLKLTNTSSLVGVSNSKVNSTVKGVAQNKVNTNALQDNVITLSSLVSDIRKRLTEAGI